MTDRPIVIDRPLSLWLIRAHRGDLLPSLVSVLDATPWKVIKTAGRVRVEVGHPRFGPENREVPEEGFHLVAEVLGASMRHALPYFHDACHFAETANRMTSSSEIITVLDPDIEHYEADVCTGFRLPWPLQDREFLHYVTTDVSQDTEGRAIGLVGTKDHPDR